MPPLPQHTKDTDMEVSGRPTVSGSGRAEVHVCSSRTVSARKREGGQEETAREGERERTQMHRAVPHPTPPPVMLGLARCLSLKPAARPAAQHFVRRQEGTKAREPDRAQCLCRPCLSREFLLELSLVDWAGGLPSCKWDKCTPQTLSTARAPEVWVENTISKVVLSSPRGCVCTRLGIYPHGT